MRKFFTEIKNLIDDKVFLEGLDANHIKNVLRLKPGDNIIVNVGKNIEYEAKIKVLNKDKIEAEIINSYHIETEPKVNISLFQAIPKGEKMEYIIQKAVEIGVIKIIPVITDRVIVKLDSKNSKTKTERWQRISEQASKQNKRSIIPGISAPLKLEESIKLLREHDLVVILYENESNTKLRDILLKLDNSIKDIAVLIGPEGGLDEKELEILKEFNIVSLGNRILRTETAGLVASTIILYQLGDLG
ncbi:MAG: 16S rRNA (uracil(1498)-N(3))-methyltransferase [Deltaproteobacteria bacterium]